jgi:hypothetical protein
MSESRQSRQQTIVPSAQPARRRQARCAFRDQRPGSQGPVPCIVSAALTSSGAKPFDFVSVHFPERLLGRARAEFSHELARRQIAVRGRFGIVLVGKGLDRLALEETPVSHIPSRCHGPAYHSFRVTAPWRATEAREPFPWRCASSQSPVPAPLDPACQRASDKILRTRATRMNEFQRSLRHHRRGGPSSPEREKASYATRYLSHSRRHPRTPDDIDVGEPTVCPIAGGRRAHE